MKLSGIVSVDPCVVSKGALNLGDAARLIAPLPDYYSDAVPRRHRRVATRVVNFILPTRNVNMSGSLLLLSLRLIIGALLVYHGVAGSLQHAMNPWLVTAGAMICLGLFSRPVSFAVCCAAVSQVVMALTSGVFMEMLSIEALLSLCVAVAGPGWLSVDGLMRVALVKRIRRAYSSAANPFLSTT